MHSHPTPQTHTIKQMLYDNPQLVSTYLDAIAAESAFAATTPPTPAAAGAAAAADAPAGPSDQQQQAASAAASAAVQQSGAADWGLFAVRGVLDYLRRDMTHPDGGIYSAEVRPLCVSWAAAAAGCDLCCCGVM